ncbi:PEP-CTERM sorting domain-containing protein [Methylophilus aquaticus]|uniref:PEP-CTERM sorting domain-containing protein n=1 Tax=Methylophilus aquaticus TaxID=1971610 RepID=A0ABT9JUN4_9PROT|nr:PEP-CTERM sorting domain-containing protein [Methylophilus aquaticus]MDP8568199.1 PEP-CTERM sorting domain-containing protein [Methylophilus aquaticus]
MKFQLKALTAALVLSAASLSAQAAMDTATSTGNGSFVLSMWNQASGTSATFDLGFNYNSFSDLVNQGTFNLAAGDYADAWSTFTSLSTSGTTKWAIFAGDNLGTARTVGSRGYYTTANSLDGMSQLSSTAAVSNVLAGFDVYVDANNNISTGNHSSVANGASTAALTAAAGAGSGLAYGSGKAGGAGPSAGAELDSSLQMLQILTQGTAAPTANFMADAGGTNYTFKLSSSGLLSVISVTTPVPEADSYAMLLAGLGLMGLVARRRKA